MNRLTDEVRLVTGNFDRYPGGQELPDLGKTLTYRIDGGDGVGAGLFAHDERDRVLAVKARQRARLDYAVFDAADVGNSNWGPLMCSDDDTLELTHRLYATERPQHSFAALLGHATAGEFDVLFGQ